MKKINEYDLTKSMIRKVRFLTEDINTNDNNEVTVVNDVEVRMISKDENDMYLEDSQKEQINDIIKNFKSQVSDLTEFVPGFTITPENIRMDAIIPGLDLKFTYIAGQNAGLYFNCEMLRVDDESLDTMEKLIKFNDTYSSSLNDIITDRKLN